VMACCKQQLVAGTHPGLASAQAESWMAVVTLGAPLPLCRLGRPPPASGAAPDAPMRPLLLLPQHRFIQQRLRPLIPLTTATT